jgi:phage terminase small subunit
MGNVLRNPRHERYAQGLAAGQSKQEAYKLAGYEGRSSAQLDKQPHIHNRVRELLDSRSRRAELSRKDILDRIFQDWELSRKLGQMSAALKAGHLMGTELHRMFIERKEVGGPGDFDSKSEDELKKIIEDGLHDLGWDVATAKPDKTLN